MTARTSGGTIGIAWLRAVCASNFRFRTNVNTYFYRTDIQNGYVSCSGVEMGYFF